MYHYTVEDIQQANSSCVACCCEPLALKPGSTTKVTLNYAPWAVPIGRLHCEPMFALEQMDVCPPGSGAPVKTGGNNITFDTLLSTPIEDADLNTKVEDPEAGTLVFKALALYGPKHGSLDLRSDGMFDYVPQSGYIGPDRFFFSATDESGKTTVFEALIGVGGVLAADMDETPHVSVVASSVNYQYFTAGFAVTVAPTADLCEVWKLNVQMRALDCDCICYDRTDCYDIRMVKC